MASYLSYLTSNSTQPQQQQQYASNTSTSTSTSSWSNAFSSRISLLRKALTKDSEDDDPDNEDCSHVSNVLRAYYTEKGRAFPEWLPPDPKKPLPPIVQQAQSNYGSYSGYGGQVSNQNVHARGGSGGKGGLSDLWDSGPGAVPAASQPQSLRAQRSTPQSFRPQDAAQSSGAQTNFAPALQPGGGGARLLPSQRAGSQQTVPATNSATMGSRERLRARLQGSGSGRSSPSAGNGHSADSGSGSGSSAYVSASQPWASDDPYSSNTTRGSDRYGNRLEHRQQPGGQGR